ncbi:hypothetical protein CHISP_0949 [Chitinispirillum alkaliphilum]|nr:hypothetical protein CHISP_0949 [Chitinispirillum alkaliphilum]
MERQKTKRGYVKLVVFSSVMLIMLSLTIAQRIRTADTELEDSQSEIAQNSGGISQPRFNEELRITP